MNTDINNLVPGPDKGRYRLETKTYQMRINLFSEWQTLGGYLVSDLNGGYC